MVTEVQDKSLMCECGAGPFKGPLALSGHQRSKAHQAVTEPMQAKTPNPVPDVPVAAETFVCECGVGPFQSQAALNGHRQTGVHTVAMNALKDAPIQVDYPELAGYPELRKVILARNLPARERVKQVRRVFGLYGWESAKWGNVYRPAPPNTRSDRGPQLEEWKEIKPATYGEFGSVHDFCKRYGIPVEE